jgi:hypothetical protein
MKLLAIAAGLASLVLGTPALAGNTGGGVAPGGNAGGGAASARFGAPIVARPILAPQRPISQPISATPERKQLRSSNQWYLRQSADRWFPDPCAGQFYLYSAYASSYAYPASLSSVYGNGADFICPLPSVFVTGPGWYPFGPGMTLPLTAAF